MTRIVGPVPRANFHFPEVNIQFPQFNVHFPQSNVHFPQAYVQFLRAQGRLQDFSQGGARFLGKKNVEKRNKKFSRVARYICARSAQNFFFAPP